MNQPSPGARAFFEARDLLLRYRDDYTAAKTQFRWPQLDQFNWATDVFDTLGSNPSATALRLVDDAGVDSSLSFAEVAARSNQVANYLATCGVGRGDRVLIVLPTEPALWEAMLGVIKLGAVIIPGSTLLQADELGERIERGQVKAVITRDRLTPGFAGLPGGPIRIAMGEPVANWLCYRSAYSESCELAVHPETLAEDLLILYFTSGTTSKPKLVAHTHQSYPLGHLSTLYWLGLRPGDVHLNLSSPGWAKHAWSSFFAPWNAGATVLAYEYERFSATALLDQLVRCKVSTFCAPPTVWRMLIQEDLRRWDVSLREAVSAGEPLNPQVIHEVGNAWGIALRDGFGQTETTAQIGNSPGQKIKAGSMGRPLPGMPVVLLTPDGTLGDEGEICLDLSQLPKGVMAGYLDDEERTADAFAAGLYRSGDIASRDADGYLTYVGRRDDVFKSSDYRISPFELENVLLQHPAVAEAAVVPSPDSIRLSVPKAYVVIAPGCFADAATAKSILEHVRCRVSPYKRVRRLEFASLPKTASGKIRRVELRSREWLQGQPAPRRSGEFWEEDFKG
jgi:acetyl-CoA synthetase